MRSLTLKRQTKIAADNILIFYFQRIHLKHQVLFSLKNNDKIFMNVVCCSRDWGFKRVKNLKSNWLGEYDSYKIKIVSQLQYRGPSI